MHKQRTHMRRVAEKSSGNGVSTYEILNELVLIYRSNKAPFVSNPVKSK